MLLGRQRDRHHHVIHAAIEVLFRLERYPQHRDVSLDRRVHDPREHLALDTLDHPATTARPLPFRHHTEGDVHLDQSRGARPRTPGEQRTAIALSRFAVRGCNSPHSDRRLKAPSKLVLRLPADGHG